MPCWAEQVAIESLVQTGGYYIPNLLEDAQSGLSTGGFHFHLFGSAVTAWPRAWLTATVVLCPLYDMKVALYLIKHSWFSKSRQFFQQSISPRSYRVRYLNSAEFDLSSATPLGVDPANKRQI